MAEGTFDVVDYRKYYFINLEGWYNGSDAWRYDTIRCSLREALFSAINELEDYYDKMWPEEEAEFYVETFWRKNGEGLLTIRKEWRDYNSGMKLIKHYPIKVCRWTNKEGNDYKSVWIPMSKDYRR